MRANVIIGAIVLALLLRGYFCAISDKFLEVQNTKGKEFTMTVMKEVTTTRAKCAIVCLLEKKCMSFFHDKDDGTCRLVTGTVLENQMTLVPSRPEMSYFISDLAQDDSPDFDCPLGFDEISIPGVCFKKIETPMDNDGAREHCKTYSTGNLIGHLLTVYTLEMYYKLDTMLNSGDYHIDGSKTLDGAWVDWKGDELAFVRWDGGEPNNLMGSNEKCVFTRSYGKVHDMPCSGYNTKVLCQLEYVK